MAKKEHFAEYRIDEAEKEVGSLDGVTLAGFSTYSKNAMKTDGQEAGYARRVIKISMKGEQMTNRQFIPLKQIFATCCCAIGLATGAQSQTTTYDAVNDFSLDANPNGVWSYGTLSSFTGGTFSLFTTASTNDTGEVWWNNGSEVPNIAAVEKNTTGSTESFVTIVLPSNLLRLDGQDYIADVRWTAPTTGTYDLLGLFQRIDTVAAPVSIRIIKDAATTLFSVDNFANYGNQEPFDISSLALPAGTVLDFAEGNDGDPYYNSTGFEVSIAAVAPVPEPSPWSMIALGGVALLGVMHRKKHRIA